MCYRNKGHYPNEWIVCSTTVSGGFATVHPNNKLTINVIEGAPLGDFSIEVCDSVCVVMSIPLNL